MKLCEHDCIPCCMLCKYMIPDIENSINFGSKGCSLHPDEEHQEIIDACGRWCYINLPED